MIRLLLTILLFGQGAPRPGVSATVSGRVLRADGSPAPGLRITAMDAADAGNNGSTPSLIAVAVTDATGRYSLLGLPPGRYFVLAGSLMMPTYFPGLAEPKGAIAVTVAGERNVEGIDFRLVSEELLIGPLLASDDPVAQARGAWLAAELGTSGLTRLIEEKLTARLSRFSSGSTDLAIDTMSDALIRLNAKPALALLESLHDKRPAESLVLMSRLGPAANETLLRWLGFSTNLQWAATANLLLANRAPGFVASLLRNLNLEAQIVVCDSETACQTRPRFGGMMGMGIGLGGDTVPFPIPGLPPWPSYSLSGDGWGLVTPTMPPLLAKGPIDVYYIRQVNDGFRSTCCNANWDSPPTASDRLNYIAAAAPGVTLGLKAYEERKIVWRNAETVAAERDSFHKDLLARYAALLRQLQAAGVLTAEEAAKVATPRIELTVTDPHPD